MCSYTLQRYFPSIFFRMSMLNGYIMIEEFIPFFIIHAKIGIYEKEMS